MGITSEPASVLERRNAEPDTDLERRNAERDTDPHTSVTKDDESDLVVEDLLIEDISIDGMCGVY